MDQVQVVVVITDCVEIFEIQGVVAGGVQGFGFLVPEWGQGMVEAGQFQTEGGIDIDRDVQFCGDVQPIHFIDQLLGATKGKGRDEHLAVVGQTVGEDFAEPFGSVGAVAVETVAVGGFENEEVARFRNIRVAQDRGVGAAEVSGKNHGVVVGQVEADERGAEDMAGSLELEMNTLFQSKVFIEFESVGKLVYALEQSLFFPSSEVGEAKGVFEQRHQKGFGRMGAENFAFEAVGDELGDTADMVNMGMRDKQKVDILYRDRP